MQILKIKLQSNKSGGRSQTSFIGDRDGFIRPFRQDPPGGTLISTVARPTPPSIKVVKHLWYRYHLPASSDTSDHFRP